MHARPWFVWSWFVWFLFVWAVSSGVAVGQAWHPVPAAVPTTAVVHDLVRDRLLLAGTDVEQRLFEWDGTRALERIGQLTGEKTVQHLAWDDVQHRVLALSTDRWVGSWTGGAWTWQRAGTAPPADVPVSTTWDAWRQRLVVVSGGGDVHEWDGMRWWAVAIAPPGATIAAGDAFAFDPISRRCILHGAATWSWDGFAWTPASALGPGPRTNAGLAFDAVRQRLVLYGGSATATSTWSFDGAAWVAEPTASSPGPQPAARLVADGRGVTLLATSVAGTEIWLLRGATWTFAGRLGAAPGARTNKAFAYDEARGTVVGFGGDLGGLNVPAEQTMLFDRHWLWARPATNPPLRHSAHLAWSDVDQCVLLFGGVYQGSQVRGDTWTWNGSDWIAHQPAQSPPPRHSAVLAPDPLGGVMLFGGTDGTNVFGDHWHWDGTTWRTVVPGTLPAPRALAAAGHDPANGQVVVTGGHSTVALYGGETWWWDGVQWTRSTSTIDPRGPIVWWPEVARLVAINANASYVWSGSAWSPGPAVGHGQGTFPRQTHLVADRRNGRVLLFQVPFVRQLSIHPADAASYGRGCSLGVAPVLAVVGRAWPGRAFTLELTARAPSAPAFLAVGLAPADLDVGNGCRAHVDMQLGVHVAVADGGGIARYPFAVPNAPALRGLQFTAQAAVWDPPRSPSGSATLTSGVQITVGD